MSSITTPLPPAFLATVSEGMFLRSHIARITSPTDRKTVLEASKIWQQGYIGHAFRDRNGVPIDEAAIVERAVAIVTSPDPSVLSPKKSRLGSLVERVKTTWKMFTYVQKERSALRGNRRIRALQAPSLQAHSIAKEFHSSRGNAFRLPGAFEDAAL